MNLPSYLRLGGQEIINGNRSLTYARTADTQNRLQVGLVSGATRVPEPDGPVPENLNCFCAAIEDPDRVAFSVTYVDPVTDDAPWYDPAVPASGEFLGLHATKLVLTPGMSRVISPTGLLGSTVGALRRGHRLLQADVIMFASTPAGMAFGERWLNDALATCSTSEVGILLDCGCDV